MKILKQILKELIEIRKLLQTITSSQEQNLEVDLKRFAREVENILKD